MIVFVQSIQSLDSIEVEDETIDGGKAGPLGRLSQTSYTKQQDPRMIQVTLHLFNMHTCHPSRNRIPAFFCENVSHFGHYLEKTRFPENHVHFPHPEYILCTETHAACSNNGRTCSGQVQTRLWRKQRFVYFGFAHGNAKWVDVVNVWGKSGKKSGTSCFSLVHVDSYDYGPSYVLNYFYVLKQSTISHNHFRIPCIMVCELRFSLFKMSCVVV